MNLPKSILQKCKAANSPKRRSPILTSPVLKAMKLTFVLLTAVLLQISAKGTLQTVTLSLKDAPLKTVFREIQHQTGLGFLFSEGILKDAHSLSIDVKNVPVEDVLQICFDGQPLSFSFENNKIVIFQKPANDLARQLVTLAPPVTIKGQITNEENKPLVGATITEKGTSNVTTSNAKGEFELLVSSSNAELIISYIGYGTQEVKYNGQSTMSVILVNNTTELGAVVLIGYGKSVKKADLTGAISVISAKEMEKTPMISVDQALQGRASGVQITQTSGTPGAPLKIRIRGVNSISGSNGPLIVVDGLVDVDINSVNPADIASVTVLKDASSAAIYGNRAANGVMLITTKQGTKGKTVVEFGSFVGFSQPIKKVNLLDGADFIKYANIKNVGATGNPIPVFNTQQKIDNFIAQSVDYQDQLFRTAAAKNYQLSFRGGTDKMNYYVSGNYLDQDGTIINSNFKRYAFRSNINAELTSKLRLSSNINLIAGEGFNNDVGTNNDLARGALTFETVNPVRDVNGNYVIQSLVLGGLQQNLTTNPVWAANENKNQNNRNTVQGNINLNYKLLKNLEANFSAGVEFNNSSTSYFNLNNTPGALIKAGKTTNNNTTKQYAFRITYDNTFREKHHLNLSYILEERNNKNVGFNADGQGFFTPGVGFDNLGIANIQTIGSGLSKRSLRSNMLRGIYNYDSRYLLTASIRYDESSVFLKDQGGYFPAFAFGWNINKEAFFKSNVISELRLRLGWGQTGNELIQTTDVLNLLRNNPWIPDGLTPTTAILPATRLANPNLKWETTNQKNIGLDMGFLNDRFNVTVEYYIKNTKNLLLARKVPAYTGRTDQEVNAGQVDNKGFEVSFSGKIIQNRNFSWVSNFNFSRNKNRVVSLVDGVTELFPSDQVFGSTVTPVIVKVGQPIGALYGYIFQGVDAANGNAIYAPSLNIFGNPDPNFSYSLNNTFSYKKFDINLFVLGVQGNDIFNRAALHALGRSGDVPFPTSADIRNSWTPDKKSSTIPSLNATNTQQLSSEFIEDGSFLKVKNISLGYTLKVSKIESLRLYVSAQNLFTITKYSGQDPEINSGGQDDRGGAVDLGGLANSKTITVGLNLKF